MRRRRTGCILMGVGLLLALVAGGVVFFVVSRAANVKPEEKSNVLVAAVAIGERAKIDTTMVKVIPMSVDVIPPQSLTKPDQALNMLALAPIYPGQPIIASQLVTTTQAGGVAAAMLEPGKVLVAINFGGASNILTAGAIRRGDTVDLIVKVPGPTGPVFGTAMQNLLVYEIGTVSQPSKAAAGSAPAPPSASSVFIFMVSPEDALELKYLESLNPDLILRAAADRDQPYEDRPVIDFNYVAEKYGLPIPPTSGGAILQPIPVPVPALTPAAQ